MSKAVLIAREKKDRSTFAFRVAFHMALEMCGISHDAILSRRRYLVLDFCTDGRVPRSARFPGRHVRNGAAPSKTFLSRDPAWKMAEESSGPGIIVNVSSIHPIDLAV